MTEGELQPHEVEGPVVVDLVRDDTLPDLESDTPAPRAVGGSSPTPGPGRGPVPVYQVNELQYRPAREQTVSTLSAYRFYFYLFGFVIPFVWTLFM